MPRVNGLRTRCGIWCRRRHPGGQDNRFCCRRWRRRCSSRRSGATWSNCRPSRPAGWRVRAITVVGSALALMHARPFQQWTIAELAKTAGTSRSVLAQRFQLYLGEPPLAYLARWRLQLAARLLQTTRQSVLQVATQVGYSSRPPSIARSNANSRWRQDSSAKPLLHRAVKQPGLMQQKVNVLPPRRPTMPDPHAGQPGLHQPRYCNGMTKAALAPTSRRSSKTARVIPVSYAFR